MRRLCTAVICCLALSAALVPLSPAPPAAAEEPCPPPGGADIPPAPADEPEPDEFVITGGGWGHGVGMSQYGAWGAALLGCTATEIVQGYYTGVEVEPESLEPSSVRVSLHPDRPTSDRVEDIHIAARGDDLVWELPDGDELTQDVNTWWRIEAVNGTEVQITEVDDPDDDPTEDPVWEGDTDVAITIPLDDTRAEVASKEEVYRDGTFEVLAEDGSMYLTLEITEHDDRPALERYMDGLREVPFSWHSQALGAQAITGRSYAVDRIARHGGDRDGCRCDLYDSTADQVYRPLELDTLGQRWRASVNATVGQIMTVDGDVAVGFYSSSHGGHSETATFAFSGDNPDYLQPVDDSRWEMAVAELAPSASANPHLRWRRTVTAAEVGAAFDVGTALTIELPGPHGAGTRIGDPDRTDPDGTPYGGVIVRGTDGTETVSGQAFVQGLGLETASGSSGLWSTRFDVNGQLGTFGDPEVVTVEACTPAVTVGDDVVGRVSGAERVATSIAISEHGWSSADAVVVARAADFPDALAAGALAARLDAPILLSPDDVAPPVLLDEIERLGAERAWLLGGEAALTAAVEDAIADVAAVTRLDGANRFETAAAAAVAAGPSESGTVALVQGEDWPDAVAAGNLSGGPERIPTLLTPTGTLAPETLAVLGELDATEALVLGGTAAVSADVVDAVEDAGLSVTRLGGQTRWDTALEVAAEGLDRTTDAGDAVPPHVLLASGEAFPDALAAGGLTARSPGTLVLVPSCDLSVTPQVMDWLDDEGPAHGAGIVIGGTAAVSELVRQQAAASIADDETDD